MCQALDQVQLVNDLTSSSHSPREWSYYDPHFIDEAIEAQRGYNLFHTRHLQGIELLHRDLG